MNIPKSFCPDAKDALSVLNRQFRGLSEIKVHKRSMLYPSFKPGKDMFGRSKNTVEAKLCYLYNKAHDVALSNMNDELLNIAEKIFPDKKLFTQSVINYKQHLLELFPISKSKKKFIIKNIDKEIAENPFKIYPLAVMLNRLTGFKNVFPKENFKPLKGFINLDVYKNRINFIRNYNEKIVALHETFVKPSTNPEVIKIEKELVEKYGVKTASLNDDIEAAQNVLKAVSIAKKNGYCVSDKYIVSPIVLNGGFNMQVRYGNAVLLRPSKLTSLLFKVNDNKTNMIFKNFCLQEGINETKADEIINLYKNYLIKINKYPYHTALHETIHNVFGDSLLTLANMVPKRFIETAKKATAYGYTTNQNELYTELTSKALIEGLTPAEKELHGFVNIGKPLK